MPDEKKSQLNVMILPVTREHLEQLAQMTYRNLGTTIDWLVSEAWERLEATRAAEAEKKADGAR